MGVKGGPEKTLHPLVKFLSEALHTCRELSEELAIILRHVNTNFTVRCKGALTDLI